MIQSLHRDSREIRAALHASAKARTPEDLVLALSVLIPDLTGAGFELTAKILGITKRQLLVLRQQFVVRSHDSLPPDRGRRGGRRRALLSPEAEAEFLRPWLHGAESGAVPRVAEIHRALETQLGHPVPKSTVYRLLRRHGWVGRL